MSRTKIVNSKMLGRFSRRFCSRVTFQWELPVGVSLENVEVQLRANCVSETEIESSDTSSSDSLVIEQTRRKFKGKSKTSVCVTEGSTKRAVVGTGKTEKNWYEVGSTFARMVESEFCETASLILPEESNLEQVVTGSILATHIDDKFRGSATKPEDKKFKASSFHFIASNGSEDAFEKAKAMSRGVCFARELVNAPPNVITPSMLASSAEKMAKEVGLECKILEESDCEALGMGSFLAVGACSNEPSKFIHLTHRAKNSDAQAIALVGKGLTFDSGGYNLKPTDALINLMKYDMAGSAGVLGAASVIGQLKPNVDVHFIVAACENMISGLPGSMHPGDILTASNGVTIEVDNTDAEGRLTLADALVYAQKNAECATIVDMATLTGAVKVALGDDMCGLMTNDDELANELTKACEAGGEKMWRLPLYKPYNELFKSDFADIKNAGGRLAGSITAGLFLQHFINEGTKWAHMDIAGPAWAPKPSGVHNIGGTGYGVRTLTNFVLDKSQS